jgi:hypothetical protein
MPRPGLPVRGTWSPERPAVSLADARRVADDFVLLRTLPGSIAPILALMQMQAPHIDLGFLHDGAGLIVPVAAGVLRVFDATMRKRAEIVHDPRGGFHSRGGVEMPASGLRVKS